MAASVTPLPGLDREWEPSGYAVGGAVSLTFFIPGEPEPAHRHRSRVVTPKGGKPFVQTYNDDRTTKYEQHVADVIHAQVVQVDVQGPDGAGVRLPFEEHSVYVRLRFNMEKPKSYPKRVTANTRKPDLDNLAKAVLDGLTKARLFKDDGCVTELSVGKYYCDAEHPNGVEVDVTALRVEMP